MTPLPGSGRRREQWLDESPRHPCPELPGPGPAHRDPSNPLELAVPAHPVPSRPASPHPVPPSQPAWPHLAPSRPARFARPRPVPPQPAWPHLAPSRPARFAPPSRPSPLPPAPSRPSQCTGFQGANRDKFACDKADLSQNPRPACMRRQIRIRRPNLSLFACWIGEPRPGGGLVRQGGSAWPTGANHRRGPGDPSRPYLTAVAVPTDGHCAGVPSARRADPSRPLPPPRPRSRERRRDGRVRRRRDPSRRVGSAR